MKNYVGIDLGTSGVKLLLVSEKASILGEVTVPLSVSYPKRGWAEQNPEDWYDAVLRGLKQLNARNVLCVAIGGQMHGLVALDCNDNVIRPCILWNDGRADKEVEYLNGLSVGEYTGNIAFAGFTAPKLLWMKRNEPELFKRIAKIMLPKDYLVYRLSGEFTTDYSDASGTLFLDVEHKKWSVPMLGCLGITEEVLPSLHESYDIVGVIKREIASELGWGEVSILAGAGDNAAAAVGTGTVANGDCNISLGTSGTLFIASDEYAMPKNKALHTFAHANGKYHYMGCILSAASANKWWIEDILGADYTLAEGAASQMGINDVYFLPYLMGERCPHNDVRARGAFVGMTSSTTKEEMSLAVLEGVAFAFRDCLELAKESGLNVTKSTVCGGGARLKLWSEVLANVLNLDLYALETENGPAFGAAILAMKACGRFDSLADAANKTVSERLVASPRAKTVSQYDAKYAKYKELYRSLKDFFRG